jgi:hypothetical protein
MKFLRIFLSDEDLCNALDHAPPGIIDPRSWAYWNAKLGRYPAPTMPKALCQLRKAAEGHSI